MRTIFLAAGAAIALGSCPALAQGHGQGHGGGIGGGVGGGIGGGISMPPMSSHANDHASGQVQTTIHAQTDTHASMRAHTRTGATVDHGNIAVPRGQTVRPFRVGQRLPTSYKWYSDLSGLSAPQRTSIMSQYPTANYRYLYSGGNVYVVTRNSNTVRTVIDVTP